MRRLGCVGVGCWAFALGVALLLGPPVHADGTGTALGGHDSITEGLDCATCHDARSWKTLSDTTQGGGFDHARTGFPLTGRHGQEPCTGCHRADEKISRECSSCHADTHQRKLGQDCASCHSSQSWLSVRAIERHRLTRLPLTGMHALADCTECHTRTSDVQWSGVPANCFACHEDEYRRPGLHPVHIGRAGKTPSAPFSRDCASCHRTTGWSPAFVTADSLKAGVTASGLSRAPAGHELAFPIAHGPHRSATCDDCHTSETTPRAVRCTGCHAHNPLRLRALHQGTRAALTDGSCLGCHAGGAAR
jgi:hypothetical protein